MLIWSRESDLFYFLFAPGEVSAPSEIRSLRIAGLSILLEAERIRPMNLPGIHAPRFALWIVGCLFLTALALGRVAAAEAPLPDQAVATMRKAATYFRTNAASHGGYVYYYS